MMNAEPCGPQEAVYVHSSHEYYPFESNVCQGFFMSLHRPSDDPQHLKKGSCPQRKHMHKKQRLWEHRIQFSMKERVEGPVFFGVEQDRYQKVPWHQKAVVAQIVSAIKQAAGCLYQSNGDDPEKTKDEAERPVAVFPLTMMDQFIFTGEGEHPPDLTDPNFSNLGCSKERDSAGFKATLEALDLVPGPTFTFGFSCVAHYFNTLLSRNALERMLPPMSRLHVGICPPGFITMYGLKVDDSTADDRRHLDSKKLYLWRVAFWRSHVSPYVSAANELLLSSRKGYNKAMVLNKRRNCWGCL